MKRNEVWIVDLDGVVNSNNKRDHLIPDALYNKLGKYWADWHEAHTLEEVNPVMVRRINEAYADGVAIIFCSMRHAENIKTTKYQLYDAGLKGQCSLWFISSVDNTPAPEVKENAVFEALAHIEAVGMFNTTVTFIDDSEANIRAVQESKRISDLLDKSGIQLIVELYPVFKA